MRPCAAASRRPIMKPLRIIVVGTLASDPSAGMAWMHMQIALGLRRLGHDVYYFEVTSSNLTIQSVVSHSAIVPDLNRSRPGPAPKRSEAQLHDGPLGQRCRARRVGP